MNIQIESPLAVLTMCALAVLLLPAPKWLRTAVGVGCGVYAALLVIHYVSAGV